MKTFGIYNANNEGIDTIEARDAASALRKYARINGIEIEGFWAEEIDA